MKEYTVKVFEDGTRIWYNSAGQCHREDGPAVEYPSGTKHWYKNGELHREGGPAIEFPSGTKRWYKNGRRVTEADVRPNIRVIKYDDVIAVIESEPEYPEDKCVRLKKMIQEAVWTKDEAWILHMIQMAARQTKACIISNLEDL